MVQDKSVERHPQVTCQGTKDTGAYKGAFPGGQKRVWQPGPPTSRTDALVESAPQHQRELLESLPEIVQVSENPQIFLVMGPKIDGEIMKCFCKMVRIPPSSHITKGSERPPNWERELNFVAKFMKVGYESKL